MPEHMKVVFRGRFNETPEIWSHSHNTRRPTNVPGVPNGQFDLTALRNAWATMALACCNGATYLTDVRVYRIGTDGRMVGNPSILLIPVADQPKGTNSQTLYPPQVALVVTTVANNRGPANLGRYYLPGPYMQLNADLRGSVNQAQQVASAQSTFLKAIRDSWQLDGAPDTEDANPVNISERSTNGQGTQQEITSVRVGRVLDTQRRRRNAMQEDYQSLSLT